MSKADRIATILQPAAIGQALFLGYDPAETIRMPQVVSGQLGRRSSLPVAGLLDESTAKHCQVGEVQMRDTEYLRLIYLSENLGPSVTERR